MGFDIFNNTSISVPRVLTRLKLFLRGNETALAGLVLAMMVLTFSIAYIIYESSFDKFHNGSERIYLISTIMKAMSGNEAETSRSFHFLKEFIDSEIPQVEESCRVRGITTSMVVNGQAYTGYKGLYVDESFLEIFNFPLLAGGISSLASPNSIILSSSLATTLFGDSDCLGEAVTINEELWRVSGIIKDPPGNTTLRFDFLLPVINYVRSLGNYSFVSLETYILTRPGSNDPELFLEHLDRFYQPLNENGKVKYRAKLNNIRERHQLITNTSRYYPVFIIISFVVFTVSVVNYLNSIAAWSEKNNKSTGVRWIMGATRMLIIRDITLTSVFFAMLAAFLGFGLSEVLIDIFRGLSGVDIVLNGPGLSNIRIIVVGLAVLTGIISALIPILRYSSTRAIDLIRPASRFSYGPSTIRRGLLVFQYAITGGFLTVILVILFQLRYLNQKDPGYSSENLMLIEVPKSLEFEYGRYITELKRIPGIISVTGSGSPFGEAIDFEVRSENQNSGTDANGFIVQDDFFKTYRIPLILGSGFSETTGRDSAKVIIDYSTVQMLGLINPIGQRIQLSTNEVEIIGVAGDADLCSLLGQRRPVFYTQLYDICAELVISFNGDPNIIADGVMNVFSRFEPLTNLSFRTVEEARASLYDHQSNQLKIIMSVGIISFLLTIVGAYSLAKYNSVRRTGEICIRKVLGASVKGILRSSFLDVGLMIVVAILIVSPFSYVIVGRFLEEFTEKIIVGPLPFFLSGIILYLAVIVALFWQEWKAATVNPVIGIRQQ